MLFVYSVMSTMEPTRLVQLMGVLASANQGSASEPVKRNEAAKKAQHDVDGQCLPIVALWEAFAF